jgi:hypothetical protein
VDVKIGAGGDDNLGIYLLWPWYSSYEKDISNDTAESVFLSTESVQFHLTVPCLHFGINFKVA